MSLVHAKCGKKVEAVEVFAVCPEVRYVLDDDERYHEVNVGSPFEVYSEEYICQECGQALSDEEIDLFQSLIGEPS